MVIFELGKEIEKHVFRLGTSVEQKNNSTESNLRPFGSLAPMLYQLSYRYSMMSEAHYGVHLRIINF